MEELTNGHMHIIIGLMGICPNWSACSSSAQSGWTVRRCHLGGFGLNILIGWGGPCSGGWMPAGQPHEFGYAGRAGENEVARTTKCRRICCLPKSTLFQPDTADFPRLVLSLDEVEAVRLADLEGLDQDTAAARMEVSRATFQRILYSARRTVADALVNGKALELKGGKYVLAEDHCQCERSCITCQFKCEREDHHE